MNIDQIDLAAVFAPAKTHVDDIYRLSQYQWREGIDDYQQTYHIRKDIERQFKDAKQTINVARRWADCNIPKILAELKQMRSQQ